LKKSRHEIRAAIIKRYPEVDVEKLIDAAQFRVQQWDRQAELARAVEAHNKRALALTMPSLLILAAITIVIVYFVLTGRGGDACAPSCAPNLGQPVTQPTQHVLVQPSGP
jgi:hypothetical protein